MQQSGCSLTELDVNLDETIGSVQNGIHRALFWHERGMSKVSFSKFAKKQDNQTIDAKLDRNDGKEIKCDLLIYVRLKETPNGRKMQSPWGK